MANVTAVDDLSSSLFTLYPADASLPVASDLNINPSLNIANLAIVKLASGGASPGALDLYNDLGSVNAILDVAGWFA